MAKALIKYNGLTDCVEIHTEYREKLTRSELAIVKSLGFTYDPRAGVFTLREWEERIELFDIALFDKRAAQFYCAPTQSYKRAVKVYQEKRKEAETLSMMDDFIYYANLLK